ncbi:hypothetical protein AAC387_Pa01g0478 [Persea americana]
MDSKHLTSRLSGNTLPTTTLNSSSPGSNLNPRISLLRLRKISTSPNSSIEATSPLKLAFYASIPVLQIHAFRFSSPPTPSSVHPKIHPRFWCDLDPRFVLKHALFECFYLVSFVFPEILEWI